MLGSWFVTRADPATDMYLVTGTHDPQRLQPGRGAGARHDRVGHAAMVKAAEGLYEQLRVKAPQVDVLYGIEMHKSGARHGHGLIAVPPGYRWGPVAQWWFDRYGYNRWDLVERPEAAARYAAKYVSKELGVLRIALRGGRFE